MKKDTAQDSKKDYEKVVKLVKEAKKEAEKFIKANKRIDPELQVKYL